MDMVHMQVNDMLTSLPLDRTNMCSFRMLLESCGMRCEKRKRRWHANATVLYKGLTLARM